MGEQDDRPEWFLGARTDGAVGVRDLIAIPRVLDALWAGGDPIDRVALPPMRPGSGAVSGALFDEGLDLDEELALHEEMKGRRADPPLLDAGTEAVLRAQLLDGTSSRRVTPPLTG